MKSVGLKFLVWGLRFFMSADVWQCILDTVKRMEKTPLRPGETRKAVALLSIRERLRVVDLPIPKLVNLAIEIAVLVIDPPKR